jgi:hypothetical protein
MLMTTNQAEAESEFLHLRNLVAGVVPNWKEAWPTAPVKNTSRLFFDPAPERSANRRAVEVRYDQQKSGAYAVRMIIESAMTPAESQAAAEKARRDMAGYIAGDVQEFLAASAQGFEAYKDGAPATRADGIRWWKSSRQPFLALVCEIQVRGLTKSYFCVLSESAYKGEIDLQYQELNSEVAAALPAGWARTLTDPFSGVIESRGYFSQEGTSGQIWVAYDPNQKDYTLNFQIVTTNSPPARTESPSQTQTSSDDPIGQGGFITPPP